MLKSNLLIPKLISTKEAATLLDLSPRKAKELLIKGGLSPIDVANGKKRMHRWLESAVYAFIQTLHTNAQTKKEKPAKKQAKKLHANIASMSIDDLYTLTQSPNLQ